MLKLFCLAAPLYLAWQRSGEELGTTSEDTAAGERARLFEDLLRQHEPLIYRVAYRLTGNRDDAQDLVQESVLDAYRSFHRYRIGSRFDRWMVQVVTYNYIDNWRVKSRTKIESLDQPLNEGEDNRTLELPDQSADPSLFIEQELDEPVQRALDELSPHYRTAVVLCDIAGHSYEEIATMLRVPIGTVRSRLNRARGILKNKLAEYARQRYRI